MKRFFILVIFLSFNASAEDQIYYDYNQEQEYYQEVYDEQYIEQDQTTDIEDSNDHYAHDERILIHQSDLEASAETM